MRAAVLHLLRGRHDSGTGKMVPGWTSTFVESDDEFGRWPEEVRCNFLVLRGVSFRRVSAMMSTAWRLRLT